MNSCACASVAARTTSSSVASGAPKAMFSRTVAEKRNGSCETMPISRRSDWSVTSRTSTPSIVIRPSVDVVEARDERGERRLSRARVADQRDRPAGLELEVDVVEHQAAGGVLERDVLVADAPLARRHLAGVGLVGDLLRLVHDLEDPLA